MRSLLRQVAGALPWGGFFILAPAEVLIFGALGWIPLLVWRERIRASRHSFLPGALCRLCVVVAIIAIAALLPTKHEDGRVGPLLQRDNSLGDLAVAGVIYLLGDQQHASVRVILPSATPTRREVMQAITQQTGFRASISHCGNGATVLFGSGGGRIRVLPSHKQPNQASAGNGGVASRFHSEALNRAVPEMRRWAASPSPIMNAIKSTLALVACSLALDSHASDITGRVTLKGTPPPERSVDLKSYAALATKHPNGLTTRRYQTSRDGGLQHVLVYVRGSFDGVTFEPPRTSPILDHADGLFQPYVMGIRVGQQLQLKCSDGTMCGFLATPNANQAFSMTPGQGTVMRTFTNPEVPVRFNCDLHPWNYAYVGVFAHPYFAVTDEQGRFTIRGVPPGRYSVEIFHPKGGTSAKGVVLTDQPTIVEFEVIPR